MVRGPSPGSRPGLPGPGQQLAAHPVELTDMAPPEAAQEGAQGGWRLDRAAQGAGRPPRCATHRRRQCSRRPPAQTQPGSSSCPRCTGPPRRIAQVEALLDEFGQAEMPGQGSRKEQPGIGHQAAVVEGDLDPIGGGCVVASIGCSFSEVDFLLQNHYPRSTGAPSRHFRTLT